MNKPANYRIVLAMTAVLLLNSALQAGIDEVRTRIDNERISLDFKTKSLVKVFQVYATLLGVEVHIQSCEPQTPLSISVENISVRTSLNAICESAGLRWSLEEADPPMLRIECPNRAGAGPKKILAPMKESGDRIHGKNSKGALAVPIALVNIDLQKAELKKVLKVIANVKNAQLVMDGSLEGRTVTLKSKAISLGNLLNAICSQVEARWHVSQQNPRLLIIEKKNK